MGSDQWQALGSDDRFAAVLRTLDRPAPAKGQALQELDLGDGLTVTMKKTANATQLSVRDAAASGLSAWLIERLPELVDEFKRSKQGAKS